MVAFRSPLAHLNSCLEAPSAEVCSLSLAGGTVLAAGTLLGRTEMGLQ